MIRKLTQFVSAFATREISFEMDLVPLHFKGLPIGKVRNWAFTESSVQFKPSRPWGLPTILQVEPASRCNLECRICPVARGLGRPTGEMDLAMYKRLVDELRGSVLVIMFWDWGEPFLNPHAYEMIRYARQAGIKVVSSTNGHIFARGDHARALVESGLDVVVFSVDGISQETYQRNREKGRLEEVLEGIRKVVEEKRRLGSTTPLVNFRFIVMKHSEHEVPRLREFAQGLGVDCLTLRKLHFVPGTGEGEELVPSEVQFQMPALSGDGKAPVRVSRNPCRNLWNCPTVHWDGTVCSCFMDYRESRPLGSLRERSFREIWYGQEYARLRREFRDHWRQLPLCGICSSGYAGGDVGAQANAEAIFFNLGRR